MKEGILQSVSSPYLLLAGVRGPDDHQARHVHALKGGITTRIRAIVFDLDEVHGLYNDVPMTEKEMTDEIIPALQVLVSPTTITPFDHYISHLRAAVLQVREHPLWGGFGYDLHKLLDAATLGHYDLTTAITQFEERRLDVAKQAFVNEYSPKS